MNDTGFFFLFRTFLDTFCRVIVVSDILRQEVSPWVEKGCLPKIGISQFIIEYLRKLSTHAIITFVVFLFILKEDVMQKLANIGGIITLLILLFLSYDSVKEGFLKTLGPFDSIKVQYKWVDQKVGDVKCVAKAPGEQAVPCSQKSAPELNEYKLVWEIPEKKLAEAAYANKD